MCVCVCVCGATGVQLDVKGKSCHAEYFVNIGTFTLFAVPNLPALSCKCGVRVCLCVSACVCVCVRVCVFVRGDWGTTGRKEEK